MINIDMVVGFLGAGKTTFINKLLREEGSAGTVLVENEFGQVDVDSRLLGDSIQVMEISSGCLCCTLQTDFIAGLRRVAAEYRPDRILIEPSGAASLSQILSACEKACAGMDARIRSVVTVVGAEAIPAMYFAGGPLYRGQIADAEYILISGAEQVKEEDLRECREILTELNPIAPVRWENWDLIRAADVMAEAAECRGILGNVRRPRLRAGERLCAEHFTLGRPVDDPWLAGLCIALESGVCGRVLRVKGFVQHADGQTMLLEYAPGRGVTWRRTASAEPKLCVIGTELDEQRLKAMFS